MMPREGSLAAIYSRSASAQQGREELDVQGRACARAVRAHGWTEVSRYRDNGVGGRSIQPGSALERMMADADVGSFHVLIVEDLSRLARDQVLLQGVLQRLATAGVATFTLQPQGGLAGKIDAAKRTVQRIDTSTQRQRRRGRGRS